MPTCDGDGDCMDAGDNNNVDDNADGDYDDGDGDYIDSDVDYEEEVVRDDEFLDYDHSAADGDCGCEDEENESDFDKYHAHDTYSYDVMDVVLTIQRSNDVREDIAEDNDEKDIEDDF